MATRRCAVCFLAIGALVAWSPTYSQGKAVASEASVKAALEAYVKTWNRHNVNAWAATLTEDIWYTEATDYYQRMKGKKAVIAFFGDLVKTFDLKWEIVSVKMMPDGTATDVLRHHALHPADEGRQVRKCVRKHANIGALAHRGWRMENVLLHLRQRHRAVGDEEGWRRLGARAKADSHQQTETGQRYRPAIGCRSASRT